MSKETESVQYKLLQKYDTILSKSGNAIGQTDPIEMHIATRPDAAPVVALPYPLALKHHDCLETRTQKFIRCRNHLQKYVPMGKPILLVVKKTHT